MFGMNFSKLWDLNRFFKIKGFESIFQNFGIALGILDVFHDNIFEFDIPWISWDCVGTGSNFGMRIEF